MRRKLRKWSLLLSAVVVLALPRPPGRKSRNSGLETWLNSPAATSHVGNITGNAKAAQCRLSQILRRLPWRIGRWEWRKCALARSRSPAISSWAFSSAARLRPEPCPRMRIFSTPSLAAWTAPTCLSGAPSPSNERADLVAWIKHFSPRWQNEKAGTPIQIPPEPEVTAERIKAGREVFARVQCWKCHGVQGNGQRTVGGDPHDDLGRPILPYNFTEGPAQMRRHRSGHLQNLHDWLGWHTDAVVCRQYQA